MRQALPAPSPLAPWVAALTALVLSLLVALSIHMSLSAARGDDTGRAPMANWYASPDASIALYARWASPRR